MPRTFTIVLLLIHVATASPAEPTAGTAPAHGRPSGSVAGTIVYRGEVPKSYLADNTGRARPLLEVDKHGHGLRYVAIYLEPTKMGSASADQPDQSSARDESNESSAAARIDQLDETFVPHLIAVRTGQRVVFGNSDHSNHNVRTATLVMENQFNVVVGPTNEYVHRFRADRKNRPVGLQCDVHPWMRGWIYVFDHARFAVTDRKGKFLIDNVAPGRYRLVIRQPDVGFARERAIEVVAGKATRSDFTFRANDVKRFKTKSTAGKR